MLLLTDPAVGKELMDGIAIYATVFLLAVAICLVATGFARKPTRACQSCGNDTPIDGRRCRHCGYRPGRV